MVCIFARDFPTAKQWIWFISSTSAPLRKETNNEVRIQDLRTDESLRKQYQEQFAEDIYNDLLTVEGIDKEWLNQMFDMDFDNEELMIADAE